MIRPLRRRVSDFLGRIAKAPWLSGRGPREDGVYIVLMGDNAEDLAWLLPSREQMRRVRQRQAPSSRELRLVIVTDREHVADRLAGAGHLVIRVMGHERLKKNRAWRWALRRLLRQMNRTRMRGLVMTPGFVTEFSRPYRLIRELRAALRKREAAEVKLVPSFIVTDAFTEFYHVTHFLKKVREQQIRPILRLFHYGSRVMYDYDRRLQYYPTRRVSPLGWRVACHDGTRPHGDPRYFVHIRNPLCVRELLIGLKLLMNQLGLAGITVHTQPGVRIDGDPEIEYVSSRQEFYDRTMNAPGLILADGDALMLPWLSAGCRVVLIRNASQSKGALIRCAYFVGNGRWPTFDSIRETLRALSTVSSIDEFWKGYEAKASPLEQETGPEFHEAFSAAIHEGIWPNSDPVGSDSIVQPGGEAS